MQIQHNCLFAKADAVRIPLQSDSCALVVGSPPYCRARDYLENGVNLGIARDCRDWVEWMIQVTREAIRVSKGLVIWVCAGPTQDRQYQPGPEGLLWEWYKRGTCDGDGEHFLTTGGFLEAPCYWRRNGISGSGGDQWFRKDVEYCLAFKKNLVLPHAENTACGHPPKWAPGGAMSHRLSDGTRKNQWGGNSKSGTCRNKNGGVQSPGRPSHKVHMKATNGSGHETGEAREIQGYVPPAVANPGNWLDIPPADQPNVILTNAGKGHMGSDWAHESEAPFPVSVPEFFIRSFTKPGDLVCDFFSGSGSTCEAAEALGRRSIGFDLRMSQCVIGKNRIEHPHVDVLPSKKKDKPTPLFDNLED